MTSSSANRGVYSLMCNEYSHSIAFTLLILQYFFNTFSFSLYHILDRTHHNGSGNKYMTNKFIKVPMNINMRPRNASFVDFYMLFLNVYYYYYLGVGLQGLACWSL